MQTKYIKQQKTEKHKQKSMRKWLFSAALSVRAQKVFLLFAGIS
jgi:hypothetical protein